MDFAGGGVENPVRLQPIENVVMTRNGDEGGRKQAAGGSRNSCLLPPPQCFRQRSGRNFRHSPVHYAGVFVKNNKRGVRSQNTGVRSSFFRLFP